MQKSKICNNSGKMWNITLTLLSSLIVSSWVTNRAAAEQNLEFLEFVVTNSRLPRQINVVPTVYDGQDSIYVVGGYNGTSNYFDGVVKYSLRSGDVTVIGRFHPLIGGAVVMSTDEEILYFGGQTPSDSYSNVIYSYSTRFTNYSVVGNLPTGVRDMSVAWDAENQIAYLFGGYNGQRLNTIVRYNAETHECVQIGTIPAPDSASTAIWDSGVAYIFGGDEPIVPQFRKILQFDTPSYSVIKLPELLPYGIPYGCSVFVPTQNQAYVFGWSVLQRFNTATHDIEGLAVEGWPLVLDSAGCIYVPRLGRMYILGGFGSYYGEANRRMDEIAYVELDLPEATEIPTTEPTTEDSICQPDGVYNTPYPGNCTLYIRCFNGEPQVLSCHPLRFDTIDLICKPVADVFCDQEGTPTTIAPTTTTTEPEPGRCPPIGYEVFPHESNCSKYYECINGDEFESDCAANTYFDINHEIRRCNQAELAVCNAEYPIIGIEFQAIRAKDCKWYKVCIEGYSTNLECSDGTLYDPNEQRCVQLDAYACPYVFIV